MFTTARCSHRALHRTYCKRFGVDLRPRRLAYDRGYRWTRDEPLGHADTCRSACYRCKRNVIAKTSLRHYENRTPICLFVMDPCRQADSPTHHLQLSSPASFHCTYCTMRHKETSNGNLGLAIDDVGDVDRKFHEIPRVRPVRDRANGQYVTITVNVSVLFQDPTYCGYHHLLTLDKLHMQYNCKRTGSMWLKLRHGRPQATYSTVRSAFRHHCSRRLRDNHS